MESLSDLHRRISIDTGYEWKGRSSGQYWWSGVVDKFIFKMQEHSWEPKVYLDIGSRDLMQTIEVAQYRPNTRFIAFEPVPWQYQICYQRSLEWDNIEVYNFAISDEEGYFDFYEMDQNTGASSLLEPIDVPFSNNQWKKIKVNCKRLDNILNFLGVESVDSIWMDTQGTELKVLKSLGKYLDDVLFIHAEASPEPYYKDHILKNEIEEFLNSNGFTTEFHYNGVHPYGEGDIIASKPDLVSKILNQCK
jgi:FkbM family methyltransferase